MINCPSIKTYGLIPLRRMIKVKAKKKFIALVMQVDYVHSKYEVCQCDSFNVLWKNALMSY